MFWFLRLLCTVVIVTRSMLWFCVKLSKINTGHQMASPIIHLCHNLRLFHGVINDRVYMIHIACRQVNAFICRSSSTLYTPVSKGERVPFISRPDIDISGIMNNIDLMERNVKARNTLIDFKALASLWKDMQQHKVAVDQLEIQKKKVNQLVKKVKQENSTSDEIQQMKDESKRLRNELKKIKSLYSNVSEELYNIVLKLPNFTHSNTPSGMTELITHRFGDQLKLQPWIKNHVVLGKVLDVLSFEHSHVQPGVCYLKKEAALLEQGLLFWMSDKLKENNCLHLCCPEMFKPIIVEGCGLELEDPSQVYSVIASDDVLHLAGVSIMSLAANYMMAVFEYDSLPHRCFTFGRNYDPSKESKTFSSLCSMQQSSMVQLCGITHNSFDESNHLMDEYLLFLQDLYSQLNIHMRTVNVPIGQLDPCMYRKSAIQMWLPSQNTYQEVASVYNCTDFISRRLKFRYPCNPSESAVISRKRHYCHTVFGTAMCVPSVIAILLENCQQKDGSVVFPSALWPYTFGCQGIDVKTLEQD